MKKGILILCIACCYLAGFSQEKGTFTDPRDGKVYKTVKIGSQWIMAENLAYKPSNGNYWAYNNQQSNVSKFGYLYDWETAKAVAPAGWHLPTITEWDTLYKYLGADTREVFNALLKGGNSGFNAQFGGLRRNDGVFFNKEKSTNYWSSTAQNDKEAWSLFLAAKTSIASNFAKTCFTDTDIGYSVRLFKDK